MKENPFSAPAESVNPFSYWTVATGSRFCGRRREIAELRQAIRNRQHLLINAERRIGKTSLVQQTLLELPKTQFLVCSIDLYLTDDEASFVRAVSRGITAQKAATADALLAQAKKLFHRLRPTVKLDTEGHPSLSLEVAAEMQRDPDRLLLDVLESPAKLAAESKRQVVVVLDEFQQIFTYPTDRVERHLRAALQQQPEVAWLVLGSRKRLIHRMVVDENKPLYRAFTPFNIGGIPPADWKPFLEERLARKGLRLSAEAFQEIMTLTGGHPYYTQNLCHSLWDLITPGRDLTLEDAHRARKTVLQREDYSFATLWDSLTLNQRRFLKAIADTPGRKVQYLSADFIQSSGLRAAANVQRAMQTLIDRDIVDRTNGTCDIVDQWFKLWIQMRQ